MGDLTLAQADVIGRAALEDGRRRDAKPLTVVVLDAGGHVTLVRREDGSGIARFDIAFGKAWGALGMGISSRGLSVRAAKMPGFFAALAAATDGRMVPVPGGVLVRDGADGPIIGAVGISGDTSDVDEFCAVAGIEAAGLVADIEER
ncbi:heme-binding protein [Ancylobacter sp. A5.8]|uniref:GlcG/HbpS family heme-binding protein n=1 Tax=Ancylobacter gelatini TaxID=2919920 RepID=UPI001F4E4534|nr:heme-binding protein [Ancylobacter gelatini]MCJ8141843.1 heme-binding protein [Ancylobacter gelatini]